MLMIFGKTSITLWLRFREISRNKEYFYLMIKTIRRVFAALTVTLLAFRAVGSFLSWIEHQEDTSANAWIDEEEYEDV